MNAYQMVLHRPVETAPLFGNYSSVFDNPFFVSLGLLGHSAGGLLALEAAAGDPRIKAVVIVVDSIGFLYQVTISRHSGSNRMLTI